MSLEIQLGDLAIKSAPIIGVAGTEVASKFLGFTPHEWFYAASVVYIIVQGWAVIYKTLKEDKENKNE